MKTLKGSSVPTPSSIMMPISIRSPLHRRSASTLSHLCLVATHIAPMHLPS